MRYIVVCYAVHRKGVFYCMHFDTHDEAVSSMREKAMEAFEMEKEYDENASLILESENAIVSSFNGEGIWTWDVYKM